MKTEIHLFILWENARIKEREILDDMKSSFTLLKEYEISWSRNMVASNFSRFYGQNLPDKSFKEKECGQGSFLLCIVKDDHPKYEIRHTSHGLEEVNINLFDKESLYREWTGGGHKVHCTTNEKETNHDLTLLLGKNIEDFLHNNVSPEREFIHKDIEGANGWDSISQLFYVLNNTVKYAVLRGYMELISPKPQEDIDILTDEYDNMWLIINAEGFFPHVRPKAGVFIGDVVYYLDIWDTKKDYYDLIWMRKMISSAVYSNENIRVLDEENDFYCLLYHCLTNKGAIAPKHLPKLNQYKQTFHIAENDWSKILVDWLDKHNYDIIRHKDPSNPFVISDPIINGYATHWGVCIRIVNLQCYDKITNELLHWESRVYEKENSFIKKGTSWLIDNEKYILSQLDLPFVPKLIAQGKDGASSWIEISRVQGEDLDKFLEVRANFTIENIRGIVESGLRRLVQIYQSGVMHRDIIPGNILVSRQGDRLECGFIDFGSSILYNSDTTFPCPQFLGIQYAPEDMYSDFYSFGNLCLSICRKMPFLQRIAKSLQRIQWDNYKDRVFVENVVNETLRLSQANFTLRDYYAFYRKKYSAWRKYVDNPSLAIKQTMKRVKRLFDK